MLTKAPAWRYGTLFLVAVSLSIGWGIRGNFGHEDGAAFAGCLAALAVALLSGREDWRERVAYFAFFGALGWGLGGCMSYMQVISYAESGQALSQGYGYACLFIMGFLWAAMGTAGTAFPAVASEEEVERIFRPLLFVFAAWLLLDVVQDPIARWLEPTANFDTTWYRHEDPLYWFDSNYLLAFFTLLGLGVYDLYERSGEKNRWLLPVFTAGGALAGWGIQQLLQAAGWERRLAAALTYLQGDPSYIDPGTGHPLYGASDLLNNWPQFFGDYPQHIGWLIGLVAGITVYFLIYGRFRNGASFLAYMAGGFLISFLVFPVLGSNLFTSYGGLRMTPPRSDNWAGMIGIFAGAVIWLRKNNLRPVAHASVVGGMIGGLGFAGAVWIKNIFLSFGNPKILAGKGWAPGTGHYDTVTSAWANWQHQNWHSFFEQTYGFVNGIAIAVALGMLATKVKLHERPALPPGKKPAVHWTKIFSALFVLLSLTYLNISGNVDVWSGQLNQDVWQQKVVLPDGSSTSVPAQWDVPYIGRLPGIHFLHLTPQGWFNVSWLLLVIACVLIVRRHVKQPLAIIPRTALGKGQLIFLLLLWIMVIENFERALPGFTPARLLTEWVIFLNALLATVLVLVLPHEGEKIKITAAEHNRHLYRKIWLMTIAAWLVSSLFFTITNRLIYHYPPPEKLELSKDPFMHTRFGREADWRSKPNLKNMKGR